ncbi:hypothetical protein C1H46_003771 [Malus baccata]|uniref:Uncharacterized protein n=1 Tax=Malus baccata TaxID=106549 RepID=A0A540NHY6_MALBA|nr:hypothetical protein C1H46_003771 [Malus baccata]
MRSSRTVVMAIVPCEFQLDSVDIGLMIVTGLSSRWCACRNSKDEGTVVSLCLHRRPRRDEKGEANGKEGDMVRVSPHQDSE